MVQFSCPFRNLLAVNITWFTSKTVVECKKVHGPLGVPSVIASHAVKNHIAFEM